MSRFGEPNRNKVATVKRDKVREIAETKMPDLNSASVEAQCVWLKVLHAVWASLSKTNSICFKKVAGAEFQFATFIIVNDYRFK